MGKVRLGDYINIRTGKLDANASNNDGVYPFFTCSKEPLKINTYSYDCECVLIAGNGDLNVKYYNGKFDAYQRTYIIETKNKDVLSVKFLYHFFLKYIKKLRGISIGGVIKYIKLNNLTDINFYLLNIKEQQKIVNKLDKLQKIINIRKHQIEDLEYIVKSRFVEMFGNVILNDKEWIQKKIKDSVKSEKNDIKAGPFGSSLKKDCYVKHGYKIYGQEQVINQDVTYGNYYINEEKYKELSNYIIQEDDILISLVGTYGKLLVIPKRYEAGIINPRLMKISFDKKVINSIFFKYFFTDYNVIKYLSSRTHGGTMNILNVGIIKNVPIIIPPIELQNEFVNFVEYIDKLKVECKNNLNEMQNIMNSLLDKYFC